MMVAIPPKPPKQLRLRAGSAVDIAVEEGKLVLRPARSAQPTLRQKPGRYDDEPALNSGDERLVAGVNPAEALNATPADVETRERAEAWRTENLGALDSSNSYVETYGLPLSKHRTS